MFKSTVASLYIHYVTNIHIVVHYVFCCHCLLQAKVSHVCVSPDGHRLAATAVDSHVFFFVLSNNSLQPEFSCVLPDKYPTCCCWSPDSTKLLFGFSSGSVAELAVPAAGSTYCTRWAQTTSLIAFMQASIDFLQPAYIPGSCHCTLLS